MKAALRLTLRLLGCGALVFFAGLIWYGSIRVALLDDSEPVYVRMACAPFVAAMMLLSVWRWFRRRRTARLVG